MLARALGDILPAEADTRPIDCCDVVASLAARSLTCHDACGSLRNRLSRPPSNEARSLTMTRVPGPPLARSTPSRRNSSGRGRVGLRLSVFLARSAEASSSSRARSGLRELAGSS
jgi:hypothetical protein